MNLVLVGLAVMGLVIYAVLHKSTNKMLDKALGGSSKHAKCFVCTQVATNGYLTNWTVSHFAMYLVLAFFMPDYTTLLVALGILWEVVELGVELIAQFHPGNVLCKFYISCVKPNTAFKTQAQFWKQYFGIKNTKNDLFWCSGGFLGSLMDIAANTLGVFTGYKLNRWVQPEAQLQAWAAEARRLLNTA
jgi:hypothetical protein